MKSYLGILYILLFIDLAALAITVLKYGKE